MRGALLRNAIVASAALLGACSLLLDDGFTSSDVPPNDASTTADSPGQDGAPSDDAGSEVASPPDSSCPSPPTEPGLAVWFPFEENEPDRIRDCSGHGLDGMLVADGGFQRVVGRTGGKAIDTGGDRGCFDLGVAASLAFVGSSFTVSAWIKPRAYSYPDPLGGTDPKPRWFLDRFSGTGGGWGVGTDDTALATGFVEMKSFQANGGFAEAESALTKNEWVHVAAIFTPSSMTLYVGGALAAEKALPGATPVDPQAHGWLGCRSDSEPSYDGLLDDVRIYARALSPGEISNLSK